MTNPAADVPSNASVGAPEGQAPTTPQGVPGSGIAPEVTQDAPQMVPVSELEALKQQREKDVAAVRSAEQRRASMYQQQADNYARQNAELRQQAEQFQQRVVQREMQALPPEKQEEYRLQLAAYELKQAADAVQQRESALQQREHVDQARQLRDQTARKWILRGVPANALNYTGPQEMEASAWNYLQQRNQQPVPATRVTGAASGAPPPTSDIEQINQMNYADRREAYKRLDRQAKAAKRNRR